MKRMRMTIQRIQSKMPKTGYNIGKSERNNKTGIMRVKIYVKMGTICNQNENKGYWNNHIPNEDNPIQKQNCNNANQHEHVTKFNMHIVNCNDQNDNDNIEKQNKNMHNGNCNDQNDNDNIEKQNQNFYLNSVPYHSYKPYFVVYTFLVFHLD